MLSHHDLSLLPSPRIFKTHWRYSRVAKWGGKYIYISRDGKDVAVSYFYFHKTHLQYTGSFDQFFELFMKGKVRYGSWFRDVAEWRSHSGEANVLFITYEELTSNFEACVRRIAAFCGVELSTEKYATVRDTCSFAFMKMHENKFDDLAEQLHELGFVDGKFLRQGKIGAWREDMTPLQQQIFAEEYKKWVALSSA
jgi:Sulfotransferase domain